MLPIRTLASVFNGTKEAIRDLVRLRLDVIRTIQQHRQRLNFCGIMVTANRVEIHLRFQIRLLNDRTPLKYVIASMLETRVYDEDNRPEKTPKPSERGNWRSPLSTHLAVRYLRTLCLIFERTRFHHFPYVSTHYPNQSLLISFESSSRTSLPQINR